MSKEAVCHPLQGDEEAALEAQEGVEGAVAGEGVEAEREEGVEGVGGAAVEQGADGVVAGDLLDAEQGLAVGAGLLVLHAALEGEEGRVLQEEASVFVVKPKTGGNRAAAGYFAAASGGPQAMAFV